jgi:hypothetical protein
MASARAFVGGQPYRDDVTLLVARRGDLDLLGEVVGGGGYEALLPHSREIEVFGLRCRCLDLDKRGL